MSNYEKDIKVLDNKSAYKHRVTGLAKRMMFRDKFLHVSNQDKFYDDRRRLTLKGDRQDWQNLYALGAVNHRKFNPGAKGNDDAYVEKQLSKGNFNVKEGMKRGLNINGYTKASYTQQKLAPEKLRLNTLKNDVGYATGPYVMNMFKTPKHLLGQLSNVVHYYAKTAHKPKVFKNFQNKIYFKYDNRYLTDDKVTQLGKNIINKDINPKLHNINKIIDNCTKEEDQKSKSVLGKELKSVDEDIKKNGKRKEQKEQKEQTSKNTFGISVGKKLHRMLHQDGNHIQNSANNARARRNHKQTHHFQDRGPEM